MIITEKNLCHYLIDRGYVTPKQVVDGDFSVSQSSSRNRDYKVLIGDKGLFVKQIRAFDEVKKYTLRKEATCYWLAKNDSKYQVMKKYIPDYLAYDYENHILILSLIRNGENLHNYYNRTGKFPKEIIAQIGEILASYHSTIHKDGMGLSAQFFPRKVPWVFLLDTGEPNSFDPKNDADYELIKLVQQNSEYVSYIQQLKKEWEPTCLIHGDIKWANFLINTDYQDSNNLSLKLIDWEIADLGDPCWDIAGIYQSYLTHWVFSGGYTAKKNKGMPIQNMQPGFSSFWKTYSSRMMYKKDTSYKKLIKSIKYTGVRIIQTCFESNYYQKYLPPDSAKILQMGLNILKDPEKARTELFEIDLS